MNCCCSSPDCRANGCQLARKPIPIQNALAGNYGWTCPRCGVTHAPHVSQCGCASPTMSTGTFKVGTFKVPDDGPRMTAQPSWPAECSRHFHSRLIDQGGLEFIS